MIATAPAVALVVELHLWHAWVDSALSTPVSTSREDREGLHGLGRIDVVPSSAWDAW